MPRTRDGLLWKPQDGVTWGLETQAVLPSSSHFEDHYDVIVIGAGFAGLTAARDLTQLYNKKVLIIEGRDRIGGRTFTASLFDYHFEMGGNWVHWLQPSVWTELVRYSLDCELVATAGTSAPEHLYSVRGVYDIALANGDLGGTLGRLEKIVADFFSIDGHSARSLMPFPFDPLRAPAPWTAYEHLTVQDRLLQMKECSEADKDMLSEVAGGVTLNSNECTGFVDFLKWYALAGFNMTSFAELGSYYKIGNGGMTRLARSIYKDFRGDVMFDSVVERVEYQQESEAVQISLQTSRSKLTTIKASAVISTIPLNCLDDVEFSPPLGTAKVDAIKSGNINKGSKVHVKLSCAEPAWVAMCKPDSKKLPFLNAFQDHNAADGKSSYAIAFGLSDRLHSPVSNEHDASRIAEIYDAAFKRPDSSAEVDAIFMHDWLNDPMSRGAWAAWGPAPSSKFIASMQKGHADGRIIFASSDWAEGGYSFIDGAIEQGRKAAHRAGGLLASVLRKSSLKHSGRSLCVQEAL